VAVLDLDDCECVVGVDRVPPGTSLSSEATACSTGGETTASSGVQRSMSDGLRKTAGRMGQVTLSWARVSSFDGSPHDSPGPPGDHPTVRANAILGRARSAPPAQNERLAFAVERGTIATFMRWRTT
jgi:hypothetical protein